MENTEGEEQKISTGRKRSYSDHNMVKLAYRFNKKKLEQLKDNKNIFGKDISEFISIINELSVSLPNFVDYLKKYFSTLQMKITLLINQINYVKNSNINIMTKEKEIIEDKIEDNEKVIDEEIDLLFHNFESINDFDDFISRKKEELNNLLNESIIKEINKKYNYFKLEKNKLLIKLQNVIDDIIKIKENINNVIDKSKNVEDLEMQKDNNDDHQFRVYYNGASIIVNETPKSTKFEDIPRAVVIFISSFDVFSLKPPPELLQICPLRGLQLPLRQGL